MQKIRLFRRKECTVLSWEGKLLLTTICFITFILGLKLMPVFLSISTPQNSGILVLDGQMPDFAVEKAIEIFETGNYKYIATTGGKIQTGYYTSHYKTMAEFTGATFIKLGFNQDVLKVIPGGDIKRDRTYNSALSLKSWMLETDENTKHIDVLAVGSHARRSRLLFRKAFDNEIDVGVISVKDPSYEPSQWWKSSIGSRAIISETIAYLYVLLFFSG